MGEATLGSAAVTVAGLPVVAGELDVGAVEEAEVSDSGDFEIEVSTDPGVEHVFLVRAPEDGVGVEQGLGFIELPAGSDESSAGWDLAGSDSPEIDLGALSGTEDIFLADNSPQDLLDILNADQAELLFLAQRDNYLKLIQNRYLNTEDGGSFFFAHGSYTGLNSGINGWTDPEVAFPSSRYYVALRYGLDDDSFLDYEQLQGGAPEAELYPPAAVTENEDTDPRVFSPSTPIVFADDFEFFEPTWNGLDLQGPLPEGTWTLFFDGAQVGAYDFALSSPLDEDENFLYFVPSVRIETTGTPAQVDTVELRFVAWDPVSLSYGDISVSEELPTGGGFSFAVYYEQYGSVESFDLPDIAESPLPVSDTIFITGDDTVKTLFLVTVFYEIGDVQYIFDFEMT